MIQQLAQMILQTAIDKKAQDIYFIPKSNDYEVHLRIQNRREFLSNYDLSQMQAIISHFKFLAGMSVGEKRRCQLGSCDYTYQEDHSVALRLSTVADYRGLESLVIRILYAFSKDCQFWNKDFSQIRNFISGRGLYLFSGPVGSGKTTLMYQLALMHFSDQQIMTIEDPVEMKHENLLQLQVNDSIGNHYDSLIKLSLRHRPDCLIIGEIRDALTAQAVIRASLTGVTVFSTIHAKSIPGVIARLLELGMKSEEIANCLQGIAYQRIIAGKGVIDLATENFENHCNREWNEEIDYLAQSGYLSLDEARKEKITS